MFLVKKHYRMSPNALKLDVPDELDSIKVCTAYKLGGREIPAFPHDAAAVAAVEPVYETLPGWKTSTVGVTDFEDLPENAKNYIFYLEKILSTPVDMISTGQKRDEIIIRRNPFQAFSR